MFIKLQDIPLKFWCPYKSPSNLVKVEIQTQSQGGPKILYFKRLPCEEEASGSKTIFWVAKF